MKKNLFLVNPNIGKTIKVGGGYLVVVGCVGASPRDGIIVREAGTLIEANEIARRASG